MLVSSPAPLSLETSLSFPNLSASCDAEHSSSLPSPIPTALASTSTSTPPSLYVTFKVLQLVNQFRKRVKTRVQQSARKRTQSARKDRGAATGFCQDFELEAFNEIDRYLGRKTTHPRKEPIVAEPPPAKSIDWLLEQINQSVTSDSKSLSRVASRDKLFLERKGDFTFANERLPIKELAELLIVVKDLLGSLRSVPSSRGAKTLCEGNELLDLTLDETYIANLEHLLLCLRDQLLRTLISKLVDLVHKHVIECQRDQNKHCEEWFFEFPDARHPLSTTWPWSIRPSLAIIWGVCWMFYDSIRPPAQLIDQGDFVFDADFNMRNQQGDVVLSSSEVEQHLLQQHPHLVYHHPANRVPPFNPLGAHQPFADPHSPRTIPHSPSSGPHTTMAQPPFEQQGVQAQPGFRDRGSSLPTSHLHYSTGAHDQQQVLVTSAGQAHNNTSSAAPLAPYDYAAPAAPADWSLPQENFSSGDLGFHYANSYVQADVGTSWQAVPEYQQDLSRPVDATTLPQRARNSLTPSIRVTTDFSQLQDFQQPQDIYHSATSHSSTSTHFPQEIWSNPYTNTHLSPQTSRYPMPEATEMRTPPRSPHSTHEVVAGEQISRKRSHSVMSGGAPPIAPQLQQSSANGSRASSAAPNPAEQYAMEQYSAEQYDTQQYSGEEHEPKARTIKRGEPPTNNENKYICDFAEECQGQTFDRKCEWSKHMDKHDRPYRCPHPSCAKLQGFTYSGGLLRHEREVHGKHGGPKAQLMCPHEDCKRHSGKGFTRKENLNEHIRRVHQSRDQQSQSQVIPHKREIGDAMAGADDAETPASRVSEIAVDPEDPNSPVYKRRRYIGPGMSERSASEDVEDLKQEVNRLRAENADKDNRLMHMELKMDDVMRQLQQQQVQQVQQVQDQGHL